MPIERAEGNPFDKSHIIPTTIEELESFCLARKYISHHVRLSPGQGMKEVYEYERAKAASRYGLELLYRHEVIAVSGFQLEDNHLVINHTPQGIKRMQLSHSAYGKLRNHDFRTRMMSKYPLLATSLNLDYIQGISAQNNPKVENHTITLERGTEIIDEVFEKNGYTRGEDGNFYFFLSTLGSS